MYLHLKNMSCNACGDVNQVCCANSSCKDGACVDNKCTQAGAWGYPCGANKECAGGLSCNSVNICQNSQSGSPEYGAPCNDPNYCGSQGPGLLLTCVADTVTKVLGGTGSFMRCGCDAAGKNCGADQKTQHSRVCLDPAASAQSWDALTPPTAG